MQAPLVPGSPDLKARRTGLPPLLSAQKPINEPKDIALVFFAQLPEPPHQMQLSGCQTLVFTAFGLIGLCIAVHRHVPLPLQHVTGARHHHWYRRKHPANERFSACLGVSPALTCNKSRRTPRGGEKQLGVVQQENANVGYRPKLAAGRLMSRCYCQGIGESHNGRFIAVGKRAVTFKNFGFDAINPIL